MKWIFNINGWVEILAGLALILQPDILALQDSPATIIALKLYGILALAFGMLSLLVGRFGEHEKLIHLGVLTIIGFHLFLAFQIYGASRGGYWNGDAPFIMHLVLAVFFGALFLKHRK